MVPWTEPTASWVAHVASLVSAVGGNDETADNDEVKQKLQELQELHEKRAPLDWVTFDNITNEDVASFLRVHGRDVIGHCILVKGECLDDCAPGDRQTKFCVIVTAFIPNHRFVGRGSISKGAGAFMVRAVSARSRQVGHDLAR